MTKESIDKIHTRTNQVQSDQRRRIVAGVIAGTAMVGTFAMTAPFVTTALRSPLPYMATPKAKVRRALDYLASRNHRRELFVDLGSGDGETVRQAIQAGYQQAIGVELNPTLYALAQARRLFFWKSHERMGSSFQCRDFFTVDLSRADTIMIFGVSTTGNSHHCLTKDRQFLTLPLFSLLSALQVKPIMAQLSDKLSKECRPGATVLSYRFPLADVKERSVEIIYDEEEMRVYLFKDNHL